MKFQIPRYKGFKIGILRISPIEGGVATKVKYYIECNIPKCWSYPEVNESAKNRWLLLVLAEKSKMASKMTAKNARGCCIIYIIYYDLFY